MAPKSELVSWAKVVLAVIFGAGVFYASIMGMPSQIHELKQTVTEHDKKLAVIENDMGYIKKGIDQLVQTDQMRKNYYSRELRRDGQGK